MHTLGAGALTRAVNLHRHANERIVLLAKDDTGTCLLLCPVALAASCCVRPTMAQSYGKLISQIVLSLGGLWSESGWVLYGLCRENYKSRWIILGKELRE